MFKKVPTLLAASFALVCMATTGTALAIPSSNCSTTCDIWQVASGGRQLVFGEAADADGNPLGNLAICEQPGGGGGKNYADLMGCKNSSAASECVLIVGSEATDYIGPLTSTTGVIECTPGHKILPFAFSHGLYARGLGGGDRIYGTNNGDYLYSNTWWDYTTTTYSTADGASDSLCGQGGNDMLLGDGDNTSGGAEECFNGGGGSDDYCDGGDGSASGDRYSTTCETTNAVSSTTSNCVCGLPDFWDNL